MNVLRRYTRRSLLGSPARTLVTITGIALSMALFTAVIEGAYSGLQYLIRGTEEQTGAYHGVFRGLTEEETARVLGDSALDRTATCQNAGWAALDSEGYLVIEDVSKGFGDLLPLHLDQGRLPENEREIALSRLTLEAMGEDAPAQLGDTLTLSVGRRTGSDGRELGERDPLDPDGETLSGAEERTYTVVGFYVDLGYDIWEDLPGRVALTGGGGTGECRVYFTLKHPSRYDAWSKGTAPLRPQANFQLLRYYGVFSREILNMLCGFAGVLVFLIAFSSVALIYNSFSISVSERVKQFGLLRSAGATRRQIRDTVLLEALYLSAAGIPAGLLTGCAGIGLVLYALRDTFSSLTGYAGLETRIGLVLSPGPLLLSCGLCLATVIVSAWLPARRAVRLTAIEAIRQTGMDGGRAGSGRLTVSPVTAKLLGFPGLMAAKNFKRDGKRRRATVFSLFLSVALFISASSLCSYVTDTARIMTRGEAQRDLYAIGNPRYDAAAATSAEDPERALDVLCRAEGVIEGLYYTAVSGPSRYDEDLLSREFREALSGDIVWYNVNREDGKVDLLNVRMYFLRDDAFRALCRDNGQDPEGYFDPGRPTALFYNHYAQVYVEGSTNQRRWADWRVMDPARFPVEAVRRARVEIEGYEFVTEQLQIAEDGSEYTYLYLPEDRADGYDGQGSIEEWGGLALTAEEALEDRTMVLGAAIDRVPFAFASSEPALFYPCSAAEAVLGEGAARVRYEYAFRSQDPARSYASMYGLMAEAGLEPSVLTQASQAGRTGTLVTVLNVFAYGFIALIWLICAANVFNTVSTGVSLRRRELAMLRSAGLSWRGLRRMLGYECAAYGLWGVLLGLPVSALAAWLIYRVADSVLVIPFYLPWTGVAAAAGSAGLVTLAAWAWVLRRLRRDDLADDLRAETF